MRVRCRWTRSASGRDFRAQPVLPLGRDTASFTVRNQGQGLLRWTAQVDVGWARLEPAGGDVGAGQEVRVVVSVDRGPVAPGVREGRVSLSSNTFPGQHEVRLSLTVGPAPLLTIVRADTLIPFPVTQGWIVFRNTGKSALHWTVSSSAAWLRFEWGNFGTTINGDSAAIPLMIDRSAVPRDTVALVTIASDDTTNAARVLRVHVQGPPDQVVLPGAASARGIRLRPQLLLRH